MRSSLPLQWAPDRVVLPTFLPCLGSLHVSDPNRDSAPFSSWQHRQILHKLTCASPIITPTSETENLQAHPNLCPPGSSPPHCLSSILFSLVQVAQDCFSKFSGQQDVQRGDKYQSSVLCIPPIFKYSSFGVCSPFPWI